MPATLDAFIREALVLSADQRVSLARQRGACARAGRGGRLGETEIARADAGESTPVPAAEVFACLRSLGPGVAPRP